MSGQATMNVKYMMQTVEQRRHVHWFKVPWFAHHTLPFDITRDWRCLTRYHPQKLRRSTQGPIKHSDQSNPQDPLPPKPVLHEDGHGDQILDYKHVLRDLWQRVTTHGVNSLYALCRQSDTAMRTFGRRAWSTNCEDLKNQNPETDDCDEPRLHDLCQPDCLGRTSGLMGMLSWSLMTSLNNVAVSGSCHYALESRRRSMIVVNIVIG